MARKKEPRNYIEISNRTSLENVRSLSYMEKALSPNIGQSPEEFTKADLRALVSRFKTHYMNRVKSLKNAKLNHEKIDLTEKSKAYMDIQKSFKLRPNLTQDLKSLSVQELQALYRLYERFFSAKTSLVSETKKVLIEQRKLVSEDLFTDAQPNVDFESNFWTTYNNLKEILHTQWQGNIKYSKETGLMEGKTKFIDVYRDIVSKDEDINRRMHYVSYYYTTDAFGNSVRVKNNTPDDLINDIMEEMKKRLE